MVSREAFNERIKQSAELYSSTIADGVAEKFPDIDPVFIETIRELSMSGNKQNHISMLYWMIVIYFQSSFHTS